MLVSNPSDAEDIVLEVFGKVLARMQKGIVLSDPERYLFRAARNEAYSRLRRRRLSLRTARTVEEMHTLLEPSVNSRPVGERETLEVALLSLPPRQREVVVLKVFETMTFKDISRLLGISANTVASRYRYALGKPRMSLTSEESAEWTSSVANRAAIGRP